MVGSDEEGDFSLDVFPVMLDDDAKYQCQVGPGKLGKLLGRNFGKDWIKFVLFLFGQVHLELDHALQR